MIQLGQDKDFISFFDDGMYFGGIKGTLEKTDKIVKGTLLYEIKLDDKIIGEVWADKDLIQ